MAVLKWTLLAGALGALLVTLGTVIFLRKLGPNTCFHWSPSRWEHEDLQVQTDRDEFDSN